MLYTIISFIVQLWLLWSVGFLAFISLAAWVDGEGSVLSDDDYMKMYFVWPIVVFMLPAFGAKSLATAASKYGQSRISKKNEEASE